MPIEIRELVIKATVDGAQAPGTGTNAPGKGASSNAAPGEDLIKECVDKVLAILKEKNER
ncbi:hypothetical protein A3860_32730 [Niastella vici]|uniref:Uncharacterized protein n=1 Tax=Niastella vici TaxID=1703345 RepID=A0A1V9FQH4_9BACT|nr:DUF5908 family protein [Niastella vici]OQP60582.1 hypothetical protein A3860_32730 [Niastella vici]